MTTNYDQKRFSMEENTNITYKVMLLEKDNE